MNAIKRVLQGFATDNATACASGSGGREWKSAVPSEDHKGGGGGGLCEGVLHLFWFFLFWNDLECNQKITNSIELRIMFKTKISTEMKTFGNVWLKILIQFSTWKILELFRVAIFSVSEDDAECGFIIFPPSSLILSVRMLLKSICFGRSWIVLPPPRPIWQPDLVRRVVEVATTSAHPCGIVSSFHCRNARYVLLGFFRFRFMWRRRL